MNTVIIKTTASTLLEVSDRQAGSRRRRRRRSRPHQVDAPRGRAVEGLAVAVVGAAVAGLLQHVQLGQHAHVERTLLEGRVVALIAQHHVVHLREEEAEKTVNTQLGRVCVCVCDTQQPTNQGAPYVSLDVVKDLRGGVFLLQLLPQSDHTVHVHLHPGRRLSQEQRRCEEKY